MKEAEIEALWPEFNTYWRKECHYMATPDGIWLIKHWYKFLEGRQSKKVKLPPRAKLSGRQLDRYGKPKSKPGHFEFEGQR